MQLSCLIGYRQHQWFDFLFQCNISFSISLCYTVLQVFLDGKSPDSQRFVAEKFYPNWVSHPEWASISIFPITPSSRSYKPAKCASDDAECNVRVNRYISIEKTDLHELHLQRALDLSIPRREHAESILKPIFVFAISLIRPIILVRNFHEIFVFSKLRSWQMSCNASKLFSEYLSALDFFRKWNVKWKFKGWVRVGEGGGGEESLFAIHYIHRTFWLCLK